MIRLKNILLSNRFLLIMLLIIILSLLRNGYPLNSKYNLSDNRIVGKIQSYTVKDDKVSFIIEGKEKIKCNYYNTDVDFKLGDIVELIGELKIPNNNTIPNNFKYKKYLKNKGITYVMSVNSIKIKKQNTNIFYTIKNKLINRINSYEYSNYLHTFILGDKNYIDEEVYESYQNNGVVHLFCISGSHISLLVGIILFLLKKIKTNMLLSYLIVFIFLFIYMFLTNYGASVLRSSIFFILLSLKKLSVYNFATKEIFYLTISILLLFVPTLLYDIGFLYSASITYGLLVSERLIKGNYLKKTLIISLIAMLISLPITVNNFYEINILGVLYNIIFVPIVTFILTPLAFLVLLFSFLEPIMGFLLNIIEFLSLKFNLLSFTITIPKMNYIFIGTYYLLLYHFIKYKNIYCIYIILLIFFIKTIPFIHSNTYIYFLDVGQGDSTLIKDKNKIILIDTGGLINYDGSSTYKISDNTITLIKSLGFSKVNYLILTHGDYDHMGDAVNLVENFKVEKIIFNCGEFNEFEQELIKVLDKKKMPYYSCIKELKIDNNELYFLNNKDYGNENDNSSIIYTELNKHKFLFMGDAGVEVEEDLIQKYNLQNIDVLKVGHHGSKTSSNKMFIDEINPKYSIISVGKSNRYGHPNKEVLENLEDSKTYRTDQDGSIMFKIKKNEFEIKNYTP